MRFIVPAFLSLVLLAIPSTAKAVIILDFPEITAEPGIVSAPITIFGGDVIDSLNIGIGIDQIAGDLGSSVTVMDADPNIDANTIWTNATRSFAPPGTGGTTAGLTISNNGLNTKGPGTVATITFDATNTNPGEIFLINLNELGFTKAFLDGNEVPITSTQIGSITMVPEPSSFIYLGLVGLGYFGFKRLRRKK